MGLGVWFREEIERALLAIEEAMEEVVGVIGEETEYTRGYRDGYRAAIRALASAFGIKRKERGVWP
ncbi:MAG: hypothetical protein RMK30_06240 [Anaerolineae bacterium]|nr:hypothetical protein [Anaerolineae bacterium]MDW8102458.1 hypothetical protein [Anaerolineae bacterium]